MKNDNATGYGTKVAANVTIQLVFLGADFSVAVNAEPLSGMTMDEYGFEVEIWSSTRMRSVKFTRQQLARDSENSYIASLNSADIGLGSVRVRMIAQIPDGKFDDSTRTDIDEVITNIVIVNKL